MLKCSNAHNPHPSFTPCPARYTPQLAPDTFLAYYCHYKKYLAFFNFEPVERKQTMEQVRPIYKKLLVATIVVYVLGTAVLLTSLSIKVWEMDHDLMHLTGKH